MAAREREERGTPAEAAARDREERDTPKSEGRREENENMFLGQWEDEKFCGKCFVGKMRDKRGDWLGGDLRGRRTREKEEDWVKVVWSGGKKWEWEERCDWVENSRIEFGR